jgi:hypothetical protein
VLRLDERRTLSYPPVQRLRLVARGHLSDGGAAADSLAAVLPLRRSFRGTFRAPNAACLADIDACIAHHGCAAAVNDPKGIALIAGWYDDAAAAGLRTTGFAEELYSWMRFSEKDPRTARDGLSAACLGLSGLEAWSASLALRPAVLRLLSGAGLARLLVSEGPKVRSAARIVLIHAAEAAPAFDVGRQWYRFWLGLSAAGGAGVPMSALVDSAEHAAHLLALRSLPPGRRLVNVMRIGAAPLAPSPESARLPASELLLQDLQEFEQ